MASIYKEILIEAPATVVWDAVRDFGAVHTRLAPGFVTDTKLDGDARIVTFADGNIARERFVDCNEQRQRLVYSIVSDRMAHHNASFQVIADGAARCRLIWITDVLPNEIAPYIESQMELGAATTRKTLGGPAS